MAKRNGRGVRGAMLARRTLLTALALGLAGALTAQGYGRYRAPAVHAELPRAHGGFTFCRLHYDSVRREAGGQGWWTDYPTADSNLMLRLSQFTSTGITRRDGEPGHTVLRATDPALFRCPFLFASDTGTAGLSEEETDALRDYLLKGGFLWADDFWGDRAWEHWTAELRRILPELPIREITPDHPLFSTFYQVPRVPQVPSIQFWRQSGGETSERGAESATPRLHGIFDDQGRLLVLLSHNTDIADGWEREGEDPRFLDRFSPGSYAVGINVAIWVMTR